MSRSKKITLFAVAKAAEVSISVASRALSPDIMQNRTVAADTAFRIISCANRLGYQPRRPRIQRRAVGVIGVFVPENHTTLMLDLLTSIALIANEANTPIHYYPASDEKSYCHFVRNYADSTRNLGIIAYYPPDPKDVEFFLRMYETLKKYDAQIMMIHNNVPSDFPALSVKIDNYHGGFLAGEYLGKMQLGDYFGIGYLSDRLFSHYRNERIKGFCDGLATCKAYPTLFQLQISTELNNPIETLERILKIVEWKDEKPIGLFIDGDLNAIMASCYLSSQGIAVGKQVKLVGYDDLSSTALATYPKLTTIHLPFAEMGQAAMRKLVNLMKGYKETSEVLKPTLVIRETA